MSDDFQNRDIRWLIDEKYDGSTENKALLRADLNRLALGEPVAYVIGWVSFLNLRMYLDSRPLIPRPETEWWVEELIRVLNKQSGPADKDSGENPRTFAKDANEFASQSARAPQKVLGDPVWVGPDFSRGTGALRVLDLCAGSGAVGCAVLKSASNAEVSFGEVVPEHEATIKKNVRENGLDESRAIVRIGDLFAPFVGERFDIIAANPPYIPEDRALDESVRRFEPSIALRAGSDGLELIRRIAKETPEHMNTGGELWLECDSEHADAAQALIAEHAKRAELRTDLYGRPRLIVGYY